MGIPVGHESVRSAFLSGRRAQSWSWAWACRGGGASVDDWCAVRCLVCRAAADRSSEGGEMGLCSEDRQATQTLHTPQRQGTDK